MLRWRDPEADQSSLSSPRWKKMRGEEAVQVPDPVVRSSRKRRLSVAEDFPLPTNSLSDMALPYFTTLVRSPDLSVSYFHLGSLFSLFPAGACPSLLQ